jgi:N-acetylneuraminic acid mutarotase
VKFLFQDPTHGSAGQRLFDVVAERTKRILNDFDVAAAAGGANKPLVKTAIVKISDGRLNLWFQSVKDSAIVSAIEVIPATPTLSWTQLPDAPLAKFESMGATVNDRLYVFGGYVNASIKTTGQVARFDPGASTRWTTLRNMPENLTHSGTTTDFNYVYLAGGYVGDWLGKTTPVTRHVWRYDTATDTWTRMLNLPVDRSAGALVRVGRKLHFFAGVDPHKRDRGDHWVLDLRKPTKWVTAPSLPDPRNHLGAAEIGGKIYAIGGQHNLDEDTGNDSDVHAFDVVTGTWSQVASLPKPLSHTHNSTFILGDKIVSVGGSTSGVESVADVLSYDPAANKWSTLGQLPLPLSAATADPIAGHILVTGGTSAGSIPKNDTFINA